MSGSCTSQCENATSRCSDTVYLSALLRSIFDLRPVLFLPSLRFFNIIVIIHLWELNHPIWSGCMVALCVWHYPIMAVLLALYSR